MAEMSCFCCASGNLREITGFTALSRVTSDCKPWPKGGKLFCCEECGAVQKVADEKWLGEIKKIYEAYEIYHLSDGAEQIIFANGAAAEPRSNTLVNFVLSEADLPLEGRLIDVGCGNGAALANFSAALPSWKISGSELSDKALARLKALPNFEKLYTVGVSKIPERFDIITMIHVLEHVPQPIDFISECCGKLTQNGKLFIEVPDLEWSPFDIIIADHCNHFTSASLRYLTSRAGLGAQILTNKLLPKELSFLGRPTKEVPVAVKPNPSAGIALIEATVNWLRAVLVAAENISKEAKFGIFGTSISGIWLYGALRDRVEFFVDEDPSRIGQSFEGRPILSPEQAPARSNVYVPLAPSIAEKVVIRLNDYPANFVGPPPF